MLGRFEKDGNAAGFFNGLGQVPKMTMPSPPPVVRPEGLPGPISPIRPEIMSPGQANINSGPFQSGRTTSAGPSSIIIGQGVTSSPVPVSNYPTSIDPSRVTPYMKQRWLQQNQTQPNVALGPLIQTPRNVTVVDLPSILPRKSESPMQPPSPLPLWTSTLRTISLPKGATSGSSINPLNWLRGSNTTSSTANLTKMGPGVLSIPSSYVTPTDEAARRKRGTIRANLVQNAPISQPKPPESTAGEILKGVSNWWTNQGAWSKPPTGGSTTTISVKPPQQVNINLGPSSGKTVSQGPADPYVNIPPPSGPGTTVSKDPVTAVTTFFNNLFTNPQSGIYNPANATSWLTSPTAPTGRNVSYEPAAPRGRTDLTTTTSSTITTPSTTQGSWIFNPSSGQHEWVPNSAGSIFTVVPQFFSNLMNPQQIVMRKSPSSSYYPATGVPIGPRARTRARTGSIFNPLNWLKKIAGSNSGQTVSLPPKKKPVKKPVKLNYGPAQNYLNAQNSKA